MTKEAIINKTLDRLEELNGEDFHGYRSEVWGAVSEALDRYREGVGEVETLCWNCMCGKKKIVKAQVVKDTVLLFCECADELIDNLKQTTNNTTKEK